MRFDKIALVSILGFALSANAQDNVVVDLSVLDNLGTVYQAPGEPLFPVLPKKVKKAKPAAKAVAKTKKSQTKPKETPEIITETKAVEKEEIVVVDVEPVSPAISAAEEKILAPEPKPSDSVSPAQDLQPKTEIAKPEVSAQVITEEAPASTGMITPSQAETVVQPAEQALLVEEQAAAPVETVARTIVFADGIDELNAEQINKIDTIVKGFKNEEGNKIAIYSYNLDDGVDSFKKKRISLNRAVEVRSHLIKQGYKNFSIKVININSGSDKVNTVELEEI